MAKLPAFGIDISQFNGDVDIAGLKDQIDFVIIRCGYGSDYTSQDDPQFENNVRKCEAAGVPYGVYLYSYAKNRSMALSEAAHTLRLLKGKKPLYGVWYDVEDAALPTGETLIDNCVAYCEAIEQAGYYVGIYSFLNFWENRLNSPRLDRFDRWVAQWSPKLNFDKPYGIWQYSDSGIINGKRFDFDRAYKDYPAIIGGEEATDLTIDEVIKLAREEAQKVYSDNEKKYRTIASLPAWAKEAVEQVYRELELGGTGAGSDEQLRIDASATYVRVLVVLARLLEKLRENEDYPIDKAAGKE